MKTRLNALEKLNIIYPLSRRAVLWRSYTMCYEQTRSREQASFEQILEDLGRSWKISWKILEAR